MSSESDSPSARFAFGVRCLLRSSSPANSGAVHQWGGPVLRASPFPQTHAGQSCIPDGLFKPAGRLIMRGAAFDHERRANADPNAAPKAWKARALEEARPQHIHANRHNHCFRPCSYPPDAALERLKGPADGQLPLREDKHVPTGIQQCLRLFETLTHSRTVFFERERVAEQLSGECSPPMAENVRRRGRDHRAPSKASWKRSQDHAPIEVHVVVADNEARLLHPAQVLPPVNFQRVAAADEREQQHGLGSFSKPANGTPAGPARKPRGLLSPMFRHAHSASSGQVPLRARPLESGHRGLESSRRR